MVSILGGHSKPKKCTRICTCPIPTVSAISMYSCKIIDKKTILRTVSNTGIYCSSDKVDTFYPVQYIFKNFTVNINVPCNSWAHGDLLVWVQLDVPLCGRWPLCDQAVRLVYPLFFCTLHSSPSSINKHLTGLRLEISVATSDPPIRACHWDVASHVGYKA